ncbi:MAG: ferritin-like domain-containing protein [Gammaproteobacteria bacterium]
MQLKIETTCPTVWRFDYESTDPELDDLYELAKKNQWNVSTDIDWGRTIREDSDILDRNENALARSKFFNALSKQTQADLMANQAAFTLSQFLHGEQGALLCCGQLVDTVPGIQGKLYAATQVVDEARHVEVFHRYLKKLDKSYAITNGLKSVLDAILEAETWQAKCVGMQIMVESLAMGSFRNMLVTAKDPTLRDIVQLTSRDEARHVSFGIIALQDELPNLSDEERAGLEDFAFAALTLLAGGGGDGRTPEGTASAVQPIIDAGIDPQEMAAALAQERDSAASDTMPALRSRSLFTDYMIPNLERVGLVSDRVRPQYLEAGFLRAA